MPKSKKGKAHQIRPVSKRSPNWCKYQPEEAEALVIKLAKDGIAPSQIGTILRDQYGIPLVKPITGQKIGEILEKNGLKLKIPEDLANLMRKAGRLTNHLENNQSDIHNKKALQIVKAKIHKLSKYYKRKKILPSSWKLEKEILSPF
jgi:small subunit ribosomal protein S15